MWIAAPGAFGAATLNAEQCQPVPFVRTPAIATDQHVA